jgi:hypothetical protein
MNRTSLRLCGAAFFLFVFLPSNFLTAQSPVVIHVDAAKTLGRFTPVWDYFGYDEPNYTYMQHGRELIGELAALGPGTLQIRTHNLLTTGDGVAALKWGSTNAYTEDAAGHPVYDWKIVDRILDAYVQARATPFVEIGFMPEALSTHPEPYRHHWPKDELYVGWTYPPKDYGKWAVGASMGDALHLALWKGCGRVLELGSVERAEYRLLAWKSRGVRQTLRLLGRRSETRIARGARRWAGDDGTR